MFVYPYSLPLSLLALCPDRAWLLPFPAHGDRRAEAGCSGEADGELTPLAWVR